MPQRQLCVLQFSQDFIIVTASCQGHQNVLFKNSRVQNTAARITLRMPRTEHITPLLRMLHLLPIPSRLSYKIDSLYHTALTTAYPKYLSELLNVYTPARPLRSSLDSNILNIATARTKSYGQRVSPYHGPINWNRVPGSIRTVEGKNTFKRHLKTTLFQQNA